MISYLKMKRKKKGFILARLCNFLDEDSREKLPSAEVYFSLESSSKITKSRFIKNIDKI